MSHGRHAGPIHHMNNDHANDLLAIARAFAGHPDATSARGEHIDGEGIDLELDTPGGPVSARVDLTEPTA